MKCIHINYNQTSAKMVEWLAAEKDPLRDLICILEYSNPRRKNGGSESPEPKKNLKQELKSME